MRVSPSSLGRGGLLCGALVGLLAACSGDEPVDADGDGIADGIQVPNNVTVVVPTRPTGYVAGEVRDAVKEKVSEFVAWCRDDCEGPLGDAWMSSRPA